MHEVALITLLSHSSMLCDVDVVHSSSAAVQLYNVTSTPATLWSLYSYEDARYSVEGV